MKRQAVGSVVLFVLSGVPPLTGMMHDTTSALLTLRATRNPGALCRKLFGALSRVEFLRSRARQCLNVSPYDVPPPSNQNSKSVDGHGRCFELNYLT